MRERLGFGQFSMAVREKRGGSNVKSRTLTCITATMLLAATAITVQLSAEDNHQGPPIYTVLHTFTGADGGSPGFSGVIQDKEGNLYGTTIDGGDLSCSGYYGESGCGTVFKVDPTGKETVLHSFTGGADGRSPENGGLVRDKEGNLYGATFGGGGSDNGVVFKVDPAGKETVLYSFGYADGAGPQGPLILDEQGNLYGTTCCGGGSSAGVVFKVDPAGKETVFYSFTGGADGSSPNAPLVQDKEGNLYGTTFFGVVFKVDPAGKETVLHTLSGADGAFPYAGPAMDKEGILYGTTNEGGSNCSVPGCGGTVWKLDPTGNFTVLYNFGGGTDGAYPYTGVVLDKEGNLYGTTWVGGDLSCAEFVGYGCGTVFKRDPTGKFTVPYNFTGGADGGAAGTPVLDKDGNLYGNASYGGDLSCDPGNPGCGVVFKLTP